MGLFDNIAANAKKDKKELKDHLARAKKRRELEKAQDNLKWKKRELAQAKAKNKGR